MKIFQLNKELKKKLRKTSKSKPQKINKRPMNYLLYLQINKKKKIKDKKFYFFYLLNKIYSKLTIILFSSFYTLCIQLIKRFLYK